MGKKTVRCVIVVALTVMVVAACRQGGTDSTDSGKEKVELTWLVTSSPQREPWHKEMVEKFQNEHPHISINLQQIPYADVDQKLQTLIAGGTPPDIWCPNWSQSGFPTFQAMGALLDLSPYIEKDPEVVEGIDDNLMELYRVDGKYYGIPFQNYGSYLYYNKELFDKRGLDYPTTDWDDKSWSWDQMVEYAEKLTVTSEDINERTFGFMSNDETNKQAWLFGGDFFSADDYANGEMETPQLLDNPKNVEAIQAHVDLIQKGISPTPSQTEGLSEIGDPFISGKVAMATNGGFAFINLKAADFDWGVAALPYVEGRQASLYTDPWSISATSDHPDEAWEFLKYITDPEHGAKRYLEYTDATPAHRGLLEDWYRGIAEEAGMAYEEIKEVHEGSQRYGRGSDNHQIKQFSSIRRVIEQTMPAVYDGSMSVEEGFKVIEQGLLNLD